MWPDSPPAARVRWTSPSCTPDVFSLFVDIAGDLGPNAGTKEQTVDRLFGGDLDAWSAFDPSTVMTRHGPYDDVTGQFVVPDGTEAEPDSYRTATDTLCALTQSNGVTSAAVPLPGRHVWAVGGTAFAGTLPSQAGELHTRGVPPATIPSAAT